MITQIRCGCGSVELQLTGAPLAQYVCHCDDCQTAHGRAFPVALYPASALAVTRGEKVSLAVKTSPRSKCARCGTYLFAEVPGQPFYGVNGDLLPETLFSPQFHMQCRFAAARIEDELPHYQSLPPSFGGTGELMRW